MQENILQSALWQKFEQDLGKSVFHQKSSDFEYFAILEKSRLGAYLYVPYGPLLTPSEKTSIKSALSHALASLSSLAKENHCFFIRIEPREKFSKKVLTSLGLKKSHDLNPADTWLLDLTRSREDILHGFSQGTRTRFNTFSKKGIEVEKSSDPADLDYLISFQKSITHLKHINTFDPSYLKTELSQDFCSLYLALYTDPESKKQFPIAASLFFDDPCSSTRYYMQSAADPEFKKLPATVAILTTSLFDAKSLGIKNFDFWGIAPAGADPSHPWYGFTEFKKSFGGSEANFSGDYDLPLSLPRYRLYGTLRHLNRLLRKLKS